MDISADVTRFAPVYGRIPASLEYKSRAKFEKIIVTFHANKEIEVPLEVIYLMFELEPKLMPFLFRCMQISTSFYNATRGYLFSKPEAQREWIRKGFDQYDIYKIKNNSQYFQTEMNSVLKNMKIALADIDHISFSMTLDVDLLNHDYNKFKILALSAKENIRTLHLHINSKFYYMDESVQEIGDLTADRLAAALYRNPLTDIRLSIKGKIFSADNFVKILQAIQAKRKANIEVSFIDCKPEDLDLEEIVPYLGENIINFELIENRADLVNLASGIKAAPLSFSLFEGKLVNSKKINIRVGHVDADDVKSIEKVVSGNTVELNLAGIKGCNDILASDYDVKAGLGDQGVKSLAKIFEDFDKNPAKNIRIINLSLNNISDAGVSDLLTLMSTKSIKEIDLSWNNFSISGVEKIISYLFDKNSGSKIEFINMSELYWVGHESIKKILEDVPGIAKIRSEYFVADSPANEVSRYYKKVTYQKEDGKIINILTSKGQYWDHERAVRQLEFMRETFPENADGIKRFEKMAFNLAAGMEIDYKSEGSNSDDLDPEDISLSEGEADFPYDESESELEGSL